MAQVEPLNDVDTNKYKAKPFIKWVGGKTQLLSQFEDLYPPDLKAGKIKKYFELFLGSGAVFFDIVQKYKIEQFFLCDINQDLILTYQIIKTKPQELIKVLEQLESQYYQADNETRKILFYQLRKQYNTKILNFNYHNYEEEGIVRAALMIFLNKTCFNGLYRTNKKGEFNVPSGRYKKPKICHKDNLLAISQLLQSVKIQSASYKIYDELIDKNSFVYIDPPYRPISTTANFTSYSQFEFSDRHQIELAQYYQHLDKNRQAKIMLSNSDPHNTNLQDNFFDDLYQGYNINKVYATRMVNSDATKRGKITELLITNYK